MKAPNEYFKIAKEQCETKVIKCGSIMDIEELRRNSDAGFYLTEDMLRGCHCDLSV